MTVLFPRLDIDDVENRPVLNESKSNIRLISRRLKKWYMDQLLAIISDVQTLNGRFKKNTKKIQLQLRYQTLTGSA
jgi:hypothetical protein